MTRMYSLNNREISCHVWTKYDYSINILEIHHVKPIRIKYKL